MSLSPLKPGFAWFPELSTLTRVVEPLAAALLPARTHRSAIAANTVNTPK